MDEFDETLDSIEVPKSSTSLFFLSVVCIIVAFTHIYTGNLSNALGSLILALCTTFFVMNPTFYTITLCMASSLMYFIISTMIILSVIGSTRLTNFWDKMVLDLWAIALDAVIAGGIFSITNHIWNSPAHKCNLFIPHWGLIDGKDVAGHVWTPFNGIGRPIGYHYV